MSLYDELIAEGIDKGIEKGIETTIINSYKNGLSFEPMVAITGVNISKVKEVLIKNGLMAHE